MKKLTVNNIAIQFHCYDYENNEEVVAELFDSIDQILKEQLPDMDIKIIVSDMFSSVDIDETN